MILVFSVFLLNSGCQPKPEEVLLLDCLLETFIDHHSADSDDVIIVDEAQAWTDSSTLLMINYHSRNYLFRELDCVQAQLNGRTILYFSGVLPKSEGQIFDETLRIKTSLVWEPFDTTGLQSEQDFMMPPYNPTTAHIVIDNRHQYIREVILGENIFKECTDFY